jgi:exodeoxyribonuclease V alpha subunit
VKTRLALELSASQATALETMLESKVAILTGGPGTGKTSLVRAVSTSLEPLELKVALAAPTGRAGRRLFESTGHEATTIHRLLEADAQRGFARNADRPIEVDLLILDEASMIDLLLMEAVLEALPDHAALLLVGDKDQLPPVGPGPGAGRPHPERPPAGDGADRDLPPGGLSGIVQGAHQVINGQMPAFAKARPPTASASGSRIRPTRPPS